MSSVPSIKTLISEGEHLHQDFKFRIDDTKKIARTLAAFANTEGGRLLIGVKDNGKITGIDPNEEIHMITTAAETHCSPAIVFESRVWQEDMRLVLEINVPVAENKPIRAKDEEGKWKVYIRHDDHTLLANKIVLLVWKLKESKQSKPERFADEELNFLALFSEEEPVTLSKLYRFSTLPMKKVEHLLALLICWDLVKVEMDELGTRYLLR